MEAIQENSPRKIATILILKNILLAFRVDDPMRGA